MLRSTSPLSVAADRIGTQARESASMNRHVRSLERQPRAQRRQQQRHHVVAHRDGEAARVHAGSKEGRHVSARSMSATARVSGSTRALASAVSWYSRP